MSRLIDVHAHYVPDFYRRALIDSGSSTPDGSPIPAWDEETHLARLEELRLDAAVLSLSQPRGERTARSSGNGAARQ